MESPSSRERYHHGDLPRALQAEALAQLRVGGVSGVSLRAAARALGVDPAAVYRHFRNKDALLMAVALAGFAALAARMEAALAAEADPLARVRAIGAVYVRFAIEEREWFRLMFGPVGAAAKANLDIPPCEVPRGAFDILLSSLADWRQAAGHTWAPERAGVAAWAAVHGLAELVIDGAIPEAQAESGLEAVLDVVVAGLSHTPAASAAGLDADQRASRMR